MRVAASIVRQAFALAWILLLAVPAVAGYRFEAGALLGDAGLMSDWTAALDRHRSEAPLLEACLGNVAACPRHLRGVHLLIARAHTLEPGARIELVNRFVNKRPYRNGRPVEIESAVAETTVRLRGRWSSLAEFLARGGDCRDYATAKYHLLRLLGFAADDLRVVVTHERGTRAHHALLAVRVGADDAWLLDSDNAIYRRGAPHGTRFVYAINEHSVWDHERPEIPVRENAT